MLGDDIMVDDAVLLRRMLDVHEREGGAVLALLEVPHELISAYGCVAAEPVEDDVFRVHGIVEKPKPADAPSNLAVIGRYVFPPEIFDALDRTPPGVNGEIQITDAIGLLLADQPVHGVRFIGGPLRHRSEARLPARQRRARARPRRPRSGAPRRSCATSSSATGRA